ncbi:MAG: DNA polymerase I [Magnetococcales bacterium]|nr:DNA polymerase I [Magnetococcales bacterium]
MSDSRLFLFDGSGYFYQAFHAVRNLSRRDGFPTNAIFGFLKMLRKVLDQHQPEYLAMVFDVRGPTFRHKLYENYKAHRKPMPEELRQQIPIIKQMMDCLNIPQFELQGYEADDILGTMARAAEARGMEVIIVTADKDLLQLVTPQVTILDPKQNRFLKRAEVEAKWGVPPEMVPQVIALWGDTSDNIPGVPGVGQKTAPRLLHQYGDLDGLLDNIPRISQPKLRKNLETHIEQVRLSLSLGTINCQVPIEFDLEKLKSQAPNYDPLRALFVEMEFTAQVRALDQERALLGGSAASGPEGESSLGGDTGTDPSDPKATPASPSVEAENNYRAITSEDDFELFLKELKGQDQFSFDTETTGTDPTQAELVGLSFSWQARRAVYLPVAHTPEAAPDGQLNRERVLQALKPILENPEIAKTGQNIKYEYVLLRQYDITLAGIARDTMLFSYLIYGTARRHNLDAIALEELGRTTTTFKEVAGVGKKQLRFDAVPLERATPYACEDADVAWEAAEKMAPPLAAIPEVLKLHDEMELPLIPVLGEMERAGVLVDREALAEMSVDFTTRREALVAEIHELAGEPFNVNSTQQLGQILFEKLGIKGGKRTKTGFSTDVSVLTKLADKGHEIPARVLRYRSLTKLQSTYTDALMALIHPETGRVHTSYNQAVTLTGRLSSSDPNLQNIPIRTEEGRAIRGAFIAPKGWQLLSADYSQIELRLLAHLGKVERLMAAFREGIDVHSATASELFDTPADQVSDDERRMAKTINFGLIYGMSAFGLAKRLEINNFQARDYMDRYFLRYQGVREYMDHAIEEARRKGYAETLWGRRCRIRDIENTNRNLREFAERTAINAPLQGSAADLIKIAMIRLHKALNQGNFKSRMILQVHDELVLEVPDEELERVKPVIREAMEGAASLSVPLVVDIGTGSNWSQAH